MWHNAVGLPDDRGARRTRNCTGPAGNFPFFQVGQSATVGCVNKETLHTSCCLLAQKTQRGNPCTHTGSWQWGIPGLTQQKKIPVFYMLSTFGGFFERHAQSMWLCMTSPSRVHRSRRENSRWYLNRATNCISMFPGTFCYLCRLL